ncbi:hypothetical protein BDW22DRAFT_14445 [Trametopsis cervina]|nr:hypothetical protein BDW22DRAFT_14445 [Trametopsis cervina]
MMRRATSDGMWATHIRSYPDSLLDAMFQSLLHTGARTAFNDKPISAPPATQSTPLSPAMQRFADRPLRRSSSRIQRWIHDQQKRLSTGSTDDGSETSQDTDVPTASGSGQQSHAWLAYPHLTVPKTPPPRKDDLPKSDESYVFVGEEDVAEEEMRVAAEDAVTKRAQRARGQVVDLTSSPATPRKPRSLAPGFSTPSPLRSFARTISQSRPFSGSPVNSAHEQSPTRGGSSIFKRQSRASLHSRTSTLATALFAQRQVRESASDANTTVSSTISAGNWGIKPPSIMGRFSNASRVSSARPDDLTGMPRTSTSSSVTQSSDNAQARQSTDGTGSGTRSRNSAALSTVRSHTPSILFHPTPSLWSLPTDATHLNDPPGSEKMIAHDRIKPGSVRIPLPLKASSPPSFGSTGTLGLGSKNRKKRKLVVSGIPPGDQRRYDHVRQWCESFGEVNQIARVPNGDLHVDFRRTEVADTVCRLHARVHINGVGSVGLSWFAGKRP